MSRRALTIGIGLGYVLLGSLGGCSSSSGGGAGIYSASASTGAQKLVDTNSHIQNIIGQIHALDASHAYYVEVSASQFSLWSTAR